MLEILKFTFSSFWIFIGVNILIWNIGLGLAMATFFVFRRKE